VTGLGEFSPMGDYLLWAFFENYRRSPNFGATIFSGKSNVLISTKNGFGHFGRFFHKHIWSPCLRPTLMGLRWLLFTCALPRNGLTNSSQIQHSGNYQNSKKKMAMPTFLVWKEFYKKKKISPPKNVKNLTFWTRKSQG
jgi:hypothetical protein